MTPDTVRAVPRAPDPGGFSEPMPWVKALRRAGFKVDQQLRGLLSRIMGISGWNVADSFAWLEAEDQLTRVGDSFRLSPYAATRVDRLEGETRLPPATFDIEGENMVIHFPEDGDLRPFYGFVYSQQDEGPLEQVGNAQGRLVVPTGRHLALQAYEPGRYGRPFRGLPPDLFDRIVATQMGPKATDDDMEAFSDLYQTRQLSIGYTYEAGLIYGHGSAHRVSDTGLGHLARFERLKELGLKSRLVTDRGLAVLAKLPPLRSLQLCYADVTPTGLRGLPIDELTSLTVEWTIKIGTDLSFLRRCKDLETLGLRISGTNDAQLRHVGVLDHLTNLDVAHNSPDERFGLAEAITDDGVAHLRSMPHLHTLYLEGTAVTDRCAEHLRTLPNLKKLSIGQSAVTDRFVAEISSMHQLEDLSLMGSEISNKAFDFLVDLPNLKVLSVGATKVNHDGLDQLARITSLEHIDLTGTNVLARELGRLSGLPHLKELEVWYLTESRALQDRIHDALPGVRVMFEH